MGYVDHGSIADGLGLLAFLVVLGIIAVNSRRQK